MWNADLQSEWNSLTRSGPDPRFSRRDFVRTALGAGFAAAADLDLPPGLHAGAQRLADCLLGGEAHGEVLCGIGP